MTPYESRAAAEIDTWQNRRSGRLTRWAAGAAARIHRAVPLSIPASVTEPVTKAVGGFLEMLNDAAFWTFSDADILKEAKKAGIAAERIQDLRDEPLEKLDQVARQYFGSNKRIAALQGAGCGLGGFTLIAADIPALFTVSFRAIQQIGSSYGFDMRDPATRPMLLAIMATASSGSPAGKTALLADLRMVALRLAAGQTYPGIAKHGGAGVVIEILKNRSKAWPKEIAQHITKRKLVQMIPLAGAAVGAGVNYWFLSRTTEAAYMSFRAAHLARTGAVPAMHLPTESAQ